MPPFDGEEWKGVKAAVAADMHTSAGREAKERERIEQLTTRLVERVETSINPSACVFTLRPFADVRLSYRVDQEAATDLAMLVGAERVKRIIADQLLKQGAFAP